MRFVLMVILLLVLALDVSAQTRVLYWTATGKIETILAAKSVPAAAAGQAWLTLPGAPPDIDRNAFIVSGGRLVARSRAETDRTTSAAEVSAALREVLLLRALIQSAQALNETSGEAAITTEYDAARSRLRALRQRIAQ